MPIDLPPASIIAQTDENFKWVYSELTKVIAGHPGAIKTYTFYEDVDNWLGPWGPEGYPIGYGKFYNIAFSENEKLQANPSAKTWVWNTTIKLQEALRDFIVTFFKTSPLIALTEPILRKAAFDSHPQAYDKGGLATVALVAPELIPIIAAIPAAEFDPRSRDFEATLSQALETAGIVASKFTGGLLAAAAGPAHSGLFRRAVQQDHRRFMHQMNTSHRLTNLKRRISSGEMDYIPMLNKLIAQLNATEFPDQDYARVAHEVVIEAERRKQKLRAKTNALLELSPEIKKVVEQKFPETTGKR